MTDRALYSTEAETTVLGAMLVDPDAVGIAVEHLRRPDVFFRDAHRKLFTAMLALYEQGVPIEVITLSEQLKKTGELEGAGGYDYLAGLVDAVPTAANIEYHIAIVWELYQLRSLRAACAETMAEVGEANGKTPRDLLDAAEARLFSVGSGGNTGTVLDVRDAAQTALRRIQDRQGHKGLPGISTGFPDLDRKTGGFKPGELIVVAGRPSMGKTSWAISAACAAASRTGKTSAILSLEQGAEELMDRMLAAEARVDLVQAHQGRCTPEEMQRLARAAKALSGVPIRIDDQPGDSILEVRAKARRLAHRTDLGLIVLDYLQLLGGGSESRVQEVSAISRGLKLLAKELQVPVIAVSQLSRRSEGRPDKRPLLSDLRESGAIEQDADLVLLLYRPEYYAPADKKLALQGAAELIIAKQRNGPVGTIPLHFEAECARFDSVARARGIA